MRVIFLHGIDAQTTNYSAGLYRKIIELCQQKLAAAGRSDEYIDRQLRRLYHHEVFWADVTTDLTNRYLSLAYEHPHTFWNVLSRPIDPLGIQIMHYIKDKGDRDTGSMNILRNVDEQFARIFKPEAADTPDRRHAIIVAHSLGSVIAFDYVFGFRKWRLHADVVVDRFITLGSPIPVFTSAMGFPDSDLRLPAGVHKWVNIRSPRDVIARPVQPFFQNIDVDEHLVRTHFLPIDAHTGYWNNRPTAEIIAHEVVKALAEHDH
jgi:pimeloyl-ACP methyl ester carboxylesterase